MENIAQPIVVRCFCSNNIKSGNPAAIYMNQVLSDEEKQKIANKLNLPVTVFVSNTKHPIPSIEYFYPNKKTPLCLHGTLAAAYILFGETHQKYMRLRLSNGRVLVVRAGINQTIEVEVSSEPIDPAPLLTLDLSVKLLNMAESNIVKSLPFVVGSVGSPKLLIPVSSADVLAGLRPNYGEIKTWSLQSGVNGVYAYSVEPGKMHSYYARGFNPLSGYDEDAATGVAAAALASELSASISVKQGCVLGMPCEINVHYESRTSIWVGGKIN